VPGTPTTNLFQITKAGVVGFRIAADGGLSGMPYIVCPNLTGTLYGIVLPGAIAPTYGSISQPATNQPMFIRRSSADSVPVAVFQNTNASGTGNPIGVQTYQGSNVWWVDINGNMTANNITSSSITLPQSITNTNSFTATSFVGNTNNYYQLVVNNQNSGSNASSDIIVQSDSGNNTIGYGDFGINSSGFTGVLGTNNDVYLYSQGTSSGNGNLLLGTGTNNTQVNFYVGQLTNVTASITTNGFAGGAGLLTNLQVSNLNGYVKTNTLLQSGVIAQIVHPVMINAGTSNDIFALPQLVGTNLILSSTLSNAHIVIDYTFWASNGVTAFTTTNVYMLGSTVLVTAQLTAAFQTYNRQVRFFSDPPNNEIYTCAQPLTPTGTALIWATANSTWTSQALHLYLTPSTNIRLVMTLSVVAN
jgi:hypothetical protein